MSYIKKLQNKSEASRKQILVVSLVCSMVIVVTVWAYSLGDLFFKKEEDKQANVNENTKPFKLFANGVRDAYNNISASVGNIGTKKEEEQIVTPMIPKQIDLIPVEYEAN